MKLSSYHKSIGNNVVLKLDYDNLEIYDKVYISKIFTETIIPREPEDKSNKNCDNIIEWYSNNEFLKQSNIEFGGTGFFYDKSPPISNEIEHAKPDYYLYDDWIKICIANGAKEKEFTYYLDYSIGFLTRGCFRGCKNCVNRNCKICVAHSNILEFIDYDRPKLCFLDDNFFACKNWRNIIEEVKQTKKKFQFKQGLDERLLTDSIIHELISWNYDNDYIFAFDNIEDKKIIENKLKRIYELYPNFKKRLKFYVFCGYDRNNIYDDEFWKQDIINTFERCFILAKYSALPYIMRYEECYKSKWCGIYTNIASWANQPSIFKKFSFKLFCQCRGMSNENYKKYKRNIGLYLEEVNKKGSSWRYMDQLKEQYPDIAEKYFDIIPDSLLEYGNGKKIKSE